MSMIIDGVDFQSLPAEKFWSFPSGYKKNKQDEIYAMIMSNAYIGSRKMDGAYYRFIKDMDGNMVLQGRSESVNGGFLDKIDWVPQLHSFFDALPRGTCLLGEIYFPNNEGSRHVTTIMGCLPEKARERQEKGEKLHYYVFDVWAWAGTSMLKVTAETRFSQLGYVSECVARAGNKFIEVAKYYYGQALWDELMRVRMLDGEGIVITKSNSHAEPGKRTARKTLKIKKELDNPIDCFLTGRWKPATKVYKGDYPYEWQYWWNFKTNEKMLGRYYNDYEHGATIEPVTKAWFYGWASAVEIAVMSGDKVYPVGWISGIPDEVKKGISENPDTYRYHVVKIAAMEIMKDTLALRHGKIIEWRPDGDKPYKECTIDQLM